MGHGPGKSSRGSGPTVHQRSRSLLEIIVVTFILRETFAIVEIIFISLPFKITCCDYKYSTVYCLAAL